MTSKNNAHCLIAKYETANPFTIASKEGIDVRLVDLGKSLPGTTVSFDGSPTILLNKNLLDNKTSYTVMAHELCHALYHSDLPGFYANFYNGRGKFEREADMFATELMLSYYVEETGSMPETYEELVNSYGVKEELAEYFCE